MYKSRGATALAVFGMVLLALPVPGQVTGIVVNDSPDRAVIFNADTDTVAGSVSIPTSGATGDCSIQASSGLGFVTTFTNQVWLINVIGNSLATGTNPIAISNFGEDTSITPDGNFVVVCDGSATQPVSVINIATRTQVSTFSTGSDCNSVDVCGDNSVLVTSDNASTLRRLTINGSGVLSDTGQSVSVPSPNNVHCAPGSATAVVTQYSGGIRSYIVSGLTLVNTRATTGSAQSGAFNPAGDRFFVRGSSSIHAFTYNSATGALGASPLYTIAAGTSNGYYAMDQLAVHPNGAKFYAGVSGALNVYNTSTGALITSITNANITSPTGVCFASGISVVGQGCPHHRVHGHIDTVPPTHSGTVSGQHHGTHGHAATAGASCPPHAPGHTSGLRPEPEVGLFSSELSGREPDFAALDEDGSTGPFQRGRVMQLFGRIEGLFLDVHDKRPAVNFSPPASGSPLYHTTSLPIVRIGGREARVLFSGLAPGLAGVWQINVQITEDAPAGTLPVSISYEGDELRAVDIVIQ